MGAPVTAPVFEPVRFGPYLLLRRLAVGGMAEIFLAREHDGDGRIFVVKRLLPHIAQHPQLVQMFLDEVRVASTLDHPNIVDVFNVGAVGDQYFQSMEYLRGVDLQRVHNWCRRRNEPVPRELIFHTLLSVAEGLDHAHNKLDGQGRPLQLIHRDISPQNIFVTFEGRVKIVDFGVAKAANALHQTRTGALVGKLSYMSPEQARLESLDSRSDLFSVGIVMWELFAARKLFSVKQLGEFEVLRRICEEELPPPSQANPMCPPEFDALVKKAVQRKRDQRFQTAGEMLEAIRGVVDQLKLDVSAKNIAAIIDTKLEGLIEREAAMIEGLPSTEVQFSIREPVPSEIAELSVEISYDKIGHDEDERTQRVMRDDSSSSKRQNRITKARVSSPIPSLQPQATQRSLSRPIRRYTNRRAAYVALSVLVAVIAALAVYFVVQ